MDCVICLEPIENEREAWLISCENFHPEVFYHELCADGIIFSGDRWNKPKCPVCRARVSEKKLFWIPPPPVIEITDWVNPVEFNENSVKIIEKLHQEIEALGKQNGFLSQGLSCLESEAAKLRTKEKEDIILLQKEITKNREMSEKLQRLEEKQKKISDSWSTFLTAVQNEEEEEVTLNPVINQWSVVVNQPSRFKEDYEEGRRRIKALGRRGNPIY